MAKKRSGGRRAAGGGASAGGGGQVFETNASGETILSHSAIKYGKKDPALSPLERQKIEAEEAKIRGSKVEHSYTIEKGTGKDLHRATGTKTSVSGGGFSTRDTPSVFTHNHPRQSGELGGTFSENDISLFNSASTKTMRATAKEGTYSITKGKGYNHQGAENYRWHLQVKANRQLDKGMKKISEQYQSGKITKQEYFQQRKTLRNDVYIGIHNGMLSGQNKFGYTYTLEPNN